MANLFYTHKTVLGTSPSTGCEVRQDRGSCRELHSPESASSLQLRTASQEFSDPKKVMPAPAASVQGMKESCC